MFNLSSIKWLLVGLVIGLVFTSFKTETNNPKPTISFTFDDGKTTGFFGYSLQQWHGNILNTLSKHQIRAIMFVATHNKKTVNGKYVLQTWSDAGHRLANHTHNHPNFSLDEVTLKQYQDELLKADSILKKYKTYTKLFRYPYLKEGNSADKVFGFRTFLQQHHYKIGHVSIDCSDWYIDSRLRNRLTQNPDADLEPFKQFYLNHIYEKAMFYDSVAMALTGRHINHSLLLHHNLIAGLFLDDLITMFKQKGWQVVNADDAFNDSFYQNSPKVIPAGESLTWALAKQSGKFKSVLRYPAEGDQYEKETMDKLGL